MHSIQRKDFQHGRAEFVRPLMFRMPAWKRDENM